MDIIFEDGLGNQHDVEGNEVIEFQMEVDNEMYPVESVTDYDSYTYMKPPEKEIIKKKTETTSDRKKKHEGTKAYKHYKDAEKEKLFYLVDEKGMSVRAAALSLNINVRTAQGWVAKNNKAPQEYIQRATGSGRPVGRPPTLTDEHKDFMIEWADENIDSVTLDDMLEVLTDRFGKLDISKSGFNKFVKDKCKITFKQARLQSVERNSPEKIEERYQWVKRWAETDMDFTSNCVFIDEAAFHINLRRNYSWSKEGDRAIVKVPKTRAKTTTILGAISPFGVVNISVRRPRALAPLKKRKAAGRSTSKASSNSGTVTGHYFNFISSVLDVMDRHEEFKHHYLIMDNAPIHKHQDIKNLIESRGYKCVYLPPYSPELNPIEQFWSVCKSKLKREQLLEEETLTSRIADACNRILYSNLQGFCRYSAAKFEDCLNRKPI